MVTQGTRSTAPALARHTAGRLVGSADEVLGKPSGAASRRSWKWLAKRLAVGSLALGSLGIVTHAAPAEAATLPYWKTVRDTGIRCSNVGSSVYKSTYNLTSSQMMQVAVANYVVWTSYPSSSNGPYQVNYRSHTYSQAAIYHVCNRLHTGTGSSYYYTYAEIHYKSTPKTKCLVESGYHTNRIPIYNSFRYAGSTFSGHVSNNPC